MKRTISVEVGKGSTNHNSRKFNAKNTDPERTHLNTDFCNENIKKVYKELFEEARIRHNERQPRKDRQIPDYHEHIRSGKQEKPFHEIIIQIGNREDTGADTEIGRQAEEALKKDGYEVVKLPSFINGVPDDTSWSNDVLTPNEEALAGVNINYTNGVGGTGKNGKTFFITNDSGYPELNQAVEKYFEQAGVDKVYFAPTTEYLKQNGGVDCRTQEQPE